MEPNEEELLRLIEKDLLEEFDIIFDEEFGYEEEID